MFSSFFQPELRGLPVAGERAFNSVDLVAPDQPAKPIHAMGCRLADDYTKKLALAADEGFQAYRKAREARGKSGWLRRWLSAGS